MKIQQALTRLLAQQFTRLRRDRVRVAAMRNAYAMLVQRYPAWVESGFDRHFLQNSAAPLLEPFYQGAAVPSPADLAAAWCTQFFFTEARHPQALATILPVMTDFVDMIAHELGNPASSMPAKTLKPQLT